MSTVFLTKMESQSLNFLPKPLSDHFSKTMASLLVILITFFAKSQSRHALKVIHHCGLYYCNLEIGTLLLV